MRGLGRLALAAALALSACTSEPRAPLVCYQVDAEDCLRVAAAVLAEADFEARASLVAVVAYRGCFPGAYYPLVASDSQPPFTATVGIRFDDGRGSVLRQLGSLEDRPLHVTDGPINIEADQFIDAYANTRGVLVIGTLP
jgi:hypothetical protein